MGAELLPVAPHIPEWDGVPVVSLTMGGVYVPQPKVKSALVRKFEQMLGLNEELDLTPYFVGFEMDEFVSRVQRDLNMVRYMAA
jgi:hypothetical protein